MQIDQLLDADETDDLNYWRTPYHKYLTQGTLPTDRIEARRIHQRAKSFVLVDGDLYKRSLSGVMQRCIITEEGTKLLEDIHGGVCGHHAAPKTLIANAFRQGFYWPTVVVDATRVLRSCEGCLFYARQTHRPAQALQTIPITWPFAVWGQDLVEPFKKAPGGVTHLLVAVYKFTKWIEAWPVGKIRYVTSPMSLTEKCTTKKPKKVKILKIQRI